MRSNPGSRSKCSRSNRYLDCGKRCPGGKARLWASEWKANMACTIAAALCHIPTPLVCCTAQNSACNLGSDLYHSVHVAVQQKKHSKRFNHLKSESYHADR